MELNCSKSWSHHHFSYLPSWKKKNREERLVTHTANGLISTGFLPLILGKSISTHGKTLQESLVLPLFLISMGLAFKPRNSNPSR